MGLASLHVQAVSFPTGMCEDDKGRQTICTQTIVEIFRSNCSSVFCIQSFTSQTQITSQRLFYKYFFNWVLMKKAVKGYLECK